MLEIKDIVEFKPVSSRVLDNCIVALIATAIPVLLSAIFVVVWRW